MGRRVTNSQWLQFALYGPQIQSVTRGWLVKSGLRRFLLVLEVFITVLGQVGRWLGVLNPLQLLLHTLQQELNSQILHSVSPQRFNGVISGWDRVVGPHLHRPSVAQWNACRISADNTLILAMAAPDPAEVGGKTHGTLRTTQKPQAGHSYAPRLTTGHFYVSDFVCLCSVCGNQGVIEHEEHFLFKCPAFAEVRQ
jgi:hypothetical protein